jgi:hypothetical protein
MQFVFSLSRKLNTMKLRLLTAIVIALSIVSCKSHYRISVDQPATIKIPKEAKLIGVINNVTQVNSPETVVGSILQGEQINGNVEAANRAVDGVLNSLSRSNDVRGIVFESDSIRNDDGTLNWNFIDSIGRLQGIDAFVELNELRTVSPVGGTAVAVVTGQSRSKLDGTLFVNIHVVTTGFNFERFSVDRSYNIPLSTSGNPIDILGDVQKKREYYRKLGFNLGYQAAELIYAHRIWVNRMYFNKGSRALKAAKPMMKNGNWDIAEKQLLQDIDNGKLKARGRALYNLAVVKEGQGDIDKAIEYAERSALECYNKDANDYLVKLRQRKRIMEL